MLVTAEVKQQVLAKLTSSLATANSHYNIDIKMPTIVYKKRGTTAGTACYVTHTIDLNPALLMSNIEAFMKRTVPHELAHLITGIVYPHTNQRSWGGKRSPHGSEWKSVMNVLGADPSRCHDYDTSAVKKRTSSYEYICEGCGESMMMGIKRHNKHQAALVYGRNHYSHNGCKKAKLTWKPQYPSVLAAEKPVEVIKPVTTKKSTSGTKKERAVVIFVNKGGAANRADIIAEYMSTLEMTKAGASTYYANIKSGKWS